MHIDDTLLTNLEKLSSLSIASDKREGILTELSKIVAFIENLNELNLEDEKATFTTLSGETPFREDSPFSDSEIIKTILIHAPEKGGGFFIVPKIIE